ncbi:MAG: hypothetical protein IJ632_03370, partial [Muribaculaceae bacterium]|nr:hypothetical protein [Muribaculaceae bacterium]
MCDAAMVGSVAGRHTPQSLRASIAALRLPFGLPFGREHFVVPELRSPTRSLSPNLGEQLSSPSINLLGWN